MELQFKMPGKVYAISMSAMATAHMLVAAGTEDVRVRLCDLASGACTHTLSGHRGIEHMLVRGGSSLSKSHRILCFEKFCYGSRVIVAFLQSLK